MGSLYSYCGIIIKLVYPTELQDFVLILIKKIYGVKNAYQNLPLPPPPPVSELKIKWSLYVLFEKSIVDHFRE